MTSIATPPVRETLLEMAKSKLATRVRTAEVEHLADVLEGDEQVITLCDALFRSGTEERRGLIALTDERLICVTIGPRDLPRTELRLSTVTSVEVSTPQGSGDAKRGRLTARSSDGETLLDRIRPWERAEEIAERIQARIDEGAS